MLLGTKNVSPLGLTIKESTNIYFPTRGSFMSIDFLIQMPLCGQYLGLAKVLSACPFFTAFRPAEAVDNRPLFAYLRSS